MEKEDKQQYKNIIKQGLSIREASRILKIAPTTIYDRLKRLRERGNLEHGNTGKQNRKPRKDKELILELIKGKYDLDFSLPHLCELLEEQEGIIVKYTISGHVWINYRDKSFSLF